MSHPRLPGSDVNQEVNVSRLSIIVLLRSDSDEFERTLISVLENRPAESEVILVHDGSYTDPFDLSDEVCFAVAESNDLLDLVRAGAEIATAPIVHILADGFEATPGWVDEVATLFADEALDCASALICDVDEPELILAGGWAKHWFGVRRMIASGATAVGRLEAERIDGLYLAASFWRLPALRRSMNLSADTVAGFETLWSRVQSEQQQSPGIAMGARVYANFDNEDLQTLGFKSGRQAQCAANWSGMGAALLAFAGCLLHPYRITQWSTALGRLSGAVVGGRCRRQFQHEIGMAKGTRCENANETNLVPVVSHEMLRHVA